MIPTQNLWMALDLEGPWRRPASPMEGVCEKDPEQKTQQNGVSAGCVSNASRPRRAWVRCRLPSPPSSLWLTLGTCSVASPRRLQRKVGAGGQRRLLLLQAHELRRGAPRG